MRTEIDRTRPDSGKMREGMTSKMRMGTGDFEPQNLKEDTTHRPEVKAKEKAKAEEVLASYAVNTDTGREIVHSAVHLASKCERKHK